MGCLASRRGRGVNTTGAGTTSGNGAGNGATTTAR